MSGPPLLFLTPTLVLLLLLTVVMLDRVSSSGIPRCCLFSDISEDLNKRHPDSSGSLYTSGYTTV